MSINKGFFENYLILVYYYKNKVMKSQGKKWLP
jgi:hypothetical protein